MEELIDRHDEFLFMRHIGVEFNCSYCDNEGLRSQYTNEVRDVNHYLCWEHEAILYLRPIHLLCKVHYLANIYLLHLFILNYIDINIVALQVFALQFSLLL